MARAWAWLLAAFLAAAMCLSSLMACFGEADLQGGGSGIENPGIALSFRDRDGSPLPVTGRLRFFHAASGWEDSGFYSRALENQDTALISSRDLEALSPGTLPNDTLAPDSSLAFNIVVSGNGQEGLMRGFSLRGSRNHGYTFEHHSPGGRDGLSKVELRLAPPVLLFHGSIPAEHMSKDIRVVFVPGSPYFSPVDPAGSMMFPLLPQGIYPVKAMAHSLPPDTLLRFYCTTDSLDTGRPFTPGKWERCDP